MTKEDSIDCPSCQQPIYWKNKKAMMTRCRTCFAVGCVYCIQDKECFDCFISENGGREEEQYFKEKLITVS